MRFCRTAWNFFSSVQQFGIFQVEEVAQKVQFGAIQFGGQFGAGHEFDAQLPASRGHPRAAFHGIVIGQGHGGQAAARAVPGQFFRGEGAVGKKGVQMEIGESPGRPGARGRGRGGGGRRGRADFWRESFI